MCVQWLIDVCTTTCGVQVPMVRWWYVQKVASVQCCDGDVPSLCSGRRDRWVCCT